MNESDGRTAAIAWLENEYDGWEIEHAGKLIGKGECFKLYDPQGQPRHVLGLTRELLLESESREALWQYLDTQEVRKRLAIAGRPIVWLGTSGYLKD